MPKKYEKNGFYLTFIVLQFDDKNVIIVSAMVIAKIVIRRLKYV